MTINGTINEGSPSRPSPWLSVWFRPGRTIQQILATDPKRHVLLPAALYATLVVLTWSIGPFGRPWADWRVVAALAVAGAIAGIAYVYIMGLFLALSGMLVGGNASAMAMRAVLAWSLVPPLCGLAVYLVIVVVVELGLATGPMLNFLEAAAGLGLVVLSIWSWIIAWRMVARVSGFGFWRTAIAIVAAVIMLSMASALAVRTFLFQPFSTPSASMEPTLLVGDRFFVSKFSYGFSRFTLPFSPPLFAGRLFASEPRRGDVVVFRLPKDDSIDYVKRVIGLPGDTIQMIDGVLHINGQPIKRERAPDYVDSGQGSPGVHIKRWHETLPNGVSYYTLQQYPTTLYDNTDPYLVPAGHFFMMGDNRQNSQDSRVLAAVGYIPMENLIGRAEIIFLSLDQRTGQPDVRSERLGKLIR